MKQPTFFEGVLVAVTLSLLGGIGFFALNLVFHSDALLRLIIATISFAYVAYLLSRSHEKTGRMTILVLWILISAAISLFSPSLTLYLLVHIVLISLVRSLYFYSSLFAALLDMALNGLSVSAGVWAGLQTGSIMLSLWCFFLVQALFVIIPANMQRQKGSELHSSSQGCFDQAHRSALEALRKI